VLCMVELLARGIFRVAYALWRLSNYRQRLECTVVLYNINLRNATRKTLQHKVRNKWIIRIVFE